ncbi:MAG: 3-oxoacyl-[acyl-carrier protein] reductase [Ilumatobacteraceae bacterium]|jgi:3alpha(or 20beta)-hydroxysteroid dehydrogenase|nr:3-oxoacyl-[acyl-carrier protein] reductase [Ilumatobacteraceae bacterium]
MGRLDGKVAIVTGGARGQGGAEAALFRSEGAEVVITDVLRDEGHAHAEAIGATFLAHDVRSEEEWAEVVRQTLERHGHIDALVNNAGIFQRAKLVDTDLAMYRKIIEVNQIGVFLGMRAVVPTMIEQQSGAIVNISSVAGLRGSPGGFAYGASKFAVTGMTKSASMELARYGVRVNSIHPGMIETDMMDVVTGGNAERHDKFASSVPLKRPAEPTEVAALALFLASDESSYCTGSEFVIDGGMTA